ncbi:MAG: DUF924 family protein [Pseudomonadota bacterium]
MAQSNTEFTAKTVLDFWFPDDGFWTSQERYSAWLTQRMQGGMDDAIITRFADLTRAAARGELDHWADTARGRLALLIAFDQFPRSLWRDTPAAFAQDIKANHLVLGAIDNGHIQEYAPWERLFFVIALGHCEGPDHLARFDIIDTLTEGLIIDLPPPLAYVADRLRAQNTRVRGIIERFGRHPHRNPIYGRVSSRDEETYIATGDFPHVQKPSTD